MLQQEKPLRPRERETVCHDKKPRAAKTIKKKERKKNDCGVMNCVQIYEGSSEMIQENTKTDVP